MLCLSNYDAAEPTYGHLMGFSITSKTYKVCVSYELRRKLQQKGDTLTQDALIKIATSNEAA